MKWWLWCRLTLALILAAILAVTPAGSAEMKVAIVSRTIFYVPLWIADRAGYFKEEGLKLAIQVYDNAERISEDLHAGRVQIAVSTPESVVVDAYRGGSLRVIAGNAAKLPHFIIARPDIKTLEQLRGARFGVLSMQEGTTLLVQHLANVVGLKPDEYQILAVGGAPTRWKLLKEGRIDVGLQPFPLSYEAEAAGFNNLGAMLKYIPDYQFTSVNVDAAWASQNREMVVAFLRALRRGQVHMRSDPTEAAELAAQELKTSLAFARRGLEETEKLKILPEDLSVSLPGLSYVFDSLKSVGLIGPHDAFDFLRVVDQAYLAASTRP